MPSFELPSRREEYQGQSKITPTLLSGQGGRISAAQIPVHAADVQWQNMPVPEIIPDPLNEAVQGFGQDLAQASFVYAEKIHSYQADEAKLKFKSFLKGVYEGRTDKQGKFVPGYKYTEKSEAVAGHQQLRDTVDKEMQSVVENLSTGARAKALHGLAEMRDDVFSLAADHNSKQFKIVEDDTRVMVNASNVDGIGDKITQMFKMAKEMPPGSDVRPVFDPMFMLVENEIRRRLAHGATPKDVSKILPDVFANLSNREGGFEMAFSLKGTFKEAAASDEAREAIDKAFMSMIGERTSQQTQMHSYEQIADAEAVKRAYPEMQNRILNTGSVSQAQQLVKQYSALGAEYATAAKTLLGIRELGVSSKASTNIDGLLFMGDAIENGWDLRETLRQHRAYNADLPAGAQPVVLDKSHLNQIITYHTNGASAKIAPHIKQFRANYPDRIVQGTNIPPGSSALMIAIMSMGNKGKADSRVEDLAAGRLTAALTEEWERGKGAGNFKKIVNDFTTDLVDVKNFEDKAFNYAITDSPMPESLSILKAPDLVALKSPMNFVYAIADAAAKTEFPLSEQEKKILHKIKIDYPHTGKTAESDNAYVEVFTMDLYNRVQRHAIKTSGEHPSVQRAYEEEMPLLNYVGQRIFHPVGGGAPAAPHDFSKPLGNQP